MSSSRLISLVMIVSFVSSFFLINTVPAEDTIDNLVSAEFYIVFETGTDLKIDIAIQADKLTTDQTYNALGIKNANEQELGAFRLLLYQMLDRQLDIVFQNAEIKNFTMPVFDGETFNEELNVELTTSFFEINESIDVYEFINGVLDLGAFVNYSLRLHSEPGWNNTYFIGVKNNLAFKRTTGNLEGEYRKWTIKNWNGENPEKLAELQLKLEKPTTSTMNSEDIFLEFVLDSKFPEKNGFKNNIVINSADIEVYNILPDFIENLDFISSDGIRLLINNGFFTWDDFYNVTISPIQENVISTIEKSSFNQTLEVIFNWDTTTTTDCLNPYEITNMNNDPAIKAVLTNEDIDLLICNITSRAVFGLVNSGANLKLSENDINFGDGLDKIGYDYNIYLYLPFNLYINGRNVYSWNNSHTLSGELESDAAIFYKDEEKDTLIEIEVKNTDLNLLNFFTGKTEFNFGLDIKETRNYNVTALPEAFELPEKLSLKYLNADAFRLCVEENVFNTKDVNNFLNNEKKLFEQLLKKALPGLKLNGKVNRNIFEGSLIVWDKDISNMEKYPPIKTGSYGHSSYPISFNISYLPPSIEIPIKKFNFSGIPNQNVTYKMIFPHGISILVDDPLNKTYMDKTKDGRYYLVTTFSVSESNLTLEVSCKMTASAFFIIGIFVPCILSFVIALILIIIIYILRKKRKGKKIKTSAEEDFTGYEDEDYYVPPPKSKEK
ncbi:hypothetical protein AYK20_01220 [Thermoplasmatales archaeon SG8-52-1]|nr:MAG: hypothetical protein AYK20_01220 [Thermoplasmatales archaeon SG8-52-1]